MLKKSYVILEGTLWMDDQGLPVPISTLSDILKEKDKWIITRAS